MKSFRSPLPILSVLVLLSSCSRPEIPRYPTEPFNTLPGNLGYPFGTFCTIEGTRVEGIKVGTRTLKVDTIDGKKVPEPFSISVDNIGGAGLPQNTRIVLKGYETGCFIGQPWLPPEEIKGGSPTALFQFQCSFVPTTIVEAKNLEFQGSSKEER